MSSPYFEADAVQGCVYGFDPESPLLRAALTAPPPHEDTPLRTADLLDDLPFLHRLLQQVGTSTRRHSSHIGRSTCAAQAQRSGLVTRSSRR